MLIVILLPPPRRRLPLLLRLVLFVFHQFARWSIGIFELLTGSLGIAGQ